MADYLRRQCLATVPGDDTELIRASKRSGTVEWRHVVAACVANRARAALPQRFSEALPLRGICSTYKKHTSIYVVFNLQTADELLDKDKFFKQGKPPACDAFHLSPR